MTDLQLWLLVIGVVVIGGVLVYNRLQERAAKRRVEEAFVSRHADPLVDPEVPRREPVLSAALRHAGRTEPGQPGWLPDERFDYVIHLALPRPASAAEALGAWGTIERRFPRRALLAAGDERGWRRLVTGDSGRCTGLQAALQLASRDGAVSEADLLEFRAGVDALGAKLGAALSAPEMRPAVEAARELDALCAEADIQVALHVVAPDGESFPEEAASTAVGSADGMPFQLELHHGKAAGIQSITLLLDVPRVPDVVRSFEAMASAGRQLAAALGGRLVDDNRNPLDDRSLAAIAAQLDAEGQRLAGRGIAPGGEVALRLFS